MLVNSGSAATLPTSVDVRVDYHDPLSQTSVSSSTRSYSVPSLAPKESNALVIPLDFAQCDVFLTVDFGNGASSIFRTGNPAAC